MLEPVVMAQAFQFFPLKGDTWIEFVAPSFDTVVTVGIWTVNQEIVYQ